IFDYLWKICGFGGRALKHDQAPKYLNSPENLIYNKSRVLYGLSYSKKYIKEQDQIVIVEGYFDVVLPYQAGIKNLVASSGTALSSEQVRIIKRLTSNVVTCFDTDDAGIEATKRAYLLFQNEDIVTKVVIGINQKDPADFVLENGDAFKKLVDSASDFITFFIEKLIKDNKVDTLSGRRQALKELLPYYQSMAPTTKDFCVKELSGRLKMNERHLYEELENYKLPLDHPVRQSISSDLQSESAKMTVEDHTLALVLEYP
ncbi:MAG: toprim domain-containing protein, partial [Patescibacteria group bacterium]